MNPQALCWINQQVIPAAEARISVFDHGLLYGDGIFEGLRFYQRKIFQLDAHLQRLQHSAAAIALKLPMTLAEIRSALAQLIAQYPHDDGYLRLVITRGAGSLGIDPQKCATPQLFILADTLSVVNHADASQGIRLLIASTRRMPAQCLNPRIKSLNYLNNILARIEANEAGMDEALMLNTQGFVSEGTVDNLFIIRDGVLMTPPVSDGLLQGITRDCILQVAQESGIPCQQISLTPYDLLQADECFLSGTGAELIPVSQINQHRFAAPPQPLYPVIEQAFRQLIQRECAG
jgi:branched-chain amino acid aminotransferase